MIRHFDATRPAHLENRLYVIRLGGGEYGLYASGRGNSFGTPLAARGSRDEIRAELERVAPGREPPLALLR